MVLFMFIALLTNIVNQNSEINDVLINANIMNTNSKWRIVNDGVMGGLSSSTVSVNDEGKILFGGNVSLKNNGGFASLRSPIKDYKFENYSGIEISIKGDGKKYSISMKETSYFSGSFYTVNFQTTKDEWITLKIPFTSFALYYFGKEVRSNPQIPLNKIKEIALLIGEKQEGTFNAEIDFIKLY
jgi:hypothetical protein